MRSADLVLRARRRYDGWLIVGVLFASTGVAIGTSNYAFGLFIEPLEDTFGWQRTAISASLSFAAVGSLVAPLIGRFMDTHGARPVMVVCMSMVALSFLLRPFMTELWHWYALSILQFVPFAGASFLPTGRLVGIWFQADRGKAMGITMMGNNFGGFTMPFIVGLALTASWETAFVAIAVMTFALALITLLVVHESPHRSESSASPRPQAQPELTGWTVRQALRTRTFYAMTVVTLLATFTYSTILPHVSAHLSNEGMSTGAVVWVLSLLAVSGMAGKLFFGYLADRVGPKLAITFTQLGQIVCILLMVGYPTSPITWVSVPLFGFFMGGYGPQMMLIIQDSFGLKHFGSISGLANLSTVVSFGAGPLLAGLSFDLTGSYDDAFIIVAAMFALSIVMLTQVRKPRPTPQTLL